jgi:carbon storage regulator
MLVLTRRTREVVMIGEDIQVMVLDIDLGGERVRLGLSAPRELKITRQEPAFATSTRITPAGRP